MERFIKSDFVKYMLYFCNAVFAIIGFLFAVAGIFMIKKIAEFTKYPYASDIKTLPSLVIILGIFLVVVAIVGSFLVYAENVTFLTIYTGATFVLLILQLSMSSWSFANINKYPSSMGDLVTMAWLQNTPQNGQPMDTLQLQFDCCGRYGPSDYVSAGVNVPTSCCGDRLLVDCPDNVYLSKPGCQRVFHNFWRNYMDIIRFSGIVVILIQLIALCVTYYFVRTLRSSNSNQCY